MLVGLLAKQLYFMKIFSIYCYKDDDNDLMATKNNELQFQFTINVTKITQRSNTNAHIYND